MSGMLQRSELAAVRHLCAKIGQLLHGHSPQVQGAVLADLLAMWLAGHTAGDPIANDELRGELLAAHINVVRELIPENEAIIRNRMSRPRQPNDACPAESQ
jgi:hypothetical protein